MLIYLDLKKFTRLSKSLSGLRDETKIGLDTSTCVDIGHNHFRFVHLAPADSSTWCRCIPFSMETGFLGAWSFACPSSWRWQIFGHMPPRRRSWSTTRAFVKSRWTHRWKVHGPPKSYLAKLERFLSVLWVNIFELDLALKHLQLSTSGGASGCVLANGLSFPTCFPKLQVILTKIKWNSM